MTRSKGVAVLTILLLSACGTDRAPQPAPVAASLPPSPATFSPSPTIPDPYESTTSPSPSPLESASEEPSDEPSEEPSESPEPDEIEFDDGDLAEALLSGQDIGPGWTSGQSVGTDAEGAWPCGDEPGPVPDAQAGRSMMHNGVPVTQATVTLYAFATASDASDYLDDLRDSLRECEDEKTTVPNEDDAEMSFAEIRLFQRSSDSNADSEVLSMAVHQFRDGHPVADGVGVFYRLRDVVGSSVIVAPAARDTTMDQVAVTVAGRQIERAATELDRGR